MIYWLSFCDPDRPEGSQFLGAAIVEAPNLASALTESWSRGCNPGGEVMSAEVPVEKHADMRPHLNKLMQREELEWIFGSLATRVEFEAECPEAKTAGVCPACNSGVGTHNHDVN